MKLLNIKPYDNTFFRMGNNFDMDVSNLIQTNNLAYPSTFFGAIFTAILSMNDGFREEFLKRNKIKKYDDKDHLKILKMGQIYLYNSKQNMIYVKAPKDLFVGKNIRYGKFVEVSNENYISINLPCYMEEPNGNNLKRADSYYVSIHDFHERYIYKEFDRIGIEHEDNIFVKNLKTGIALNYNSGTVKDGLLYSIEQTEFMDKGSDEWSFVVEYDIDFEFVKKNYGVDMKGLESGQLKLGGESKVFAYKTIKNEKIEKFKNYNKDLELGDGEKLKIIFTSDTFFPLGKGIFDLFTKEEIKLLSIVNDKPIYMGGFDIASGKEKGMIKGYPAGALILIKNISGRDISVDGYLREKLKSKHNNGFNQYTYIRED